MITTFVERVDYPIYSLDFSFEDRLVLVGGGGANKSGICNKITGFTIDERKKSFVQQTSLTLADDEDCPMSVACHPNQPILSVGVNSSEEKVQAGENENCRLYEYENSTIRLLKRISTSENTQIDHYQKVTRFSRSGKYLVVGFSDGGLSILEAPNYHLTRTVRKISNSIQDADIDDEEKYLAVATHEALLILSLETGDTVQEIPAPKLNRKTQCEFRACRYVKNASGNKLYAVVNPISRGRSFICVWSLAKAIKRRYPVSKKKWASVCRRNITSFAVSPNGRLLAYSCTDLSVGLVDAQTLRPVLQVDKIHGFAITSLAFSRSGKFLCSAGSDNCCHVIVVPHDNLKLGVDYGLPVYAFLCMWMVALLAHIIVQTLK